MTTLRTKIGLLTTLINGKNNGNFNNHKKEIKQTFYKKYGNNRMQTLQFKLTLLKADLKATSSKLKWVKKNHERQFINSKFVCNSKLVYHNFKSNSIAVNKISTKNEVKSLEKYLGKGDKK